MTHSSSAVIPVWMVGNLIAANTSSASTGNVILAVADLSLSSSVEFFESRQLTVSSNQLTDSFTGYQVHIYRIH